MDVYTLVAGAFIAFLIGYFLDVVLPEKARSWQIRWKRKLAKYIANRSFDVAYVRSFILGNQIELERFWNKAMGTFRGLRVATSRRGNTIHGSYKEGSSVVDVAISPITKQKDLDPRTVEVDEVVVETYVLRLSLAARYRALRSHMEDLMAAQDRLTKALTHLLPASVGGSELEVKVRDQFPMSEMLDSIDTTLLSGEVRDREIGFTYLKNTLKVRAPLNSETIPWVRDAVAVC